MVIYKYPINKYPSSYEIAAIDGDVISCGFQNNQIVVWIKGANYSIINRRILVAFTGEFFDEKVKKFIGTLQDDNGLVYHIMEIY